VFGANVFGWTVDQPTAVRLSIASSTAASTPSTRRRVFPLGPGNKGGESETMIGHWLKASPARRAQVVLITR